MALIPVNRRASKKDPFTLREFVDQADNLINAEDMLPTMTELTRKELE